MAWGVPSPAMYAAYPSKTGSYYPGEHYLNKIIYEYTSLPAFLEIISMGNDRNQRMI